MQTTIQPEIRQNAGLATAVERATEQLRSELGPSAEIAKADWELHRNSERRPVVRLTVSDFAGSVHADFAPGELADADYVEGRLIRLCGDLLQVRSRKQVQKLKELMHQLEGE